MTEQGAYRAILLVTDGEDFASGIEKVTRESGRGRAWRYSRWDGERRRGAHPRF